MKNKRILWVLMILMLVICLFAGCGAKAPADYIGNAADTREEVESITADSAAGTSVQLPENQKWIRTIYLDAETENMAPLLTQIDEKVAQLGGYMEEREVRNGSQYSSYKNRYANLIIRIPVENVDAFVQQISGVSNVISTNETVENITLTYVATESRANALKTEEERLLELMAQAETMSDLLEIEARLTDVRYELENMTSQLRQYDNLVDFATVHLYIDEVQVLTPVKEETVWQRISGGFVESLKGVGLFIMELLIWIVVKLPYLVLVAVIVFVVILLIKKSRKKKVKDPKIPPITQQKEE